MEFARTSPKNLKLVLTARRIETLQKIAAEIKDEIGEGVKVLPIKLDVSKPEEVKEFVQSLPSEYKEIDILVNNAYVDKPGGRSVSFVLLTLQNFRGLVKGTAKAPDIAEEDIDVMFSTNVTGLINMTQAILPIYKARDEGGRGDIINIGSIAGREGYPGGSIYCATKAAIRTFTDAMRRELIATRIRVMEVCPNVHNSFRIRRRVQPYRFDHNVIPNIDADCESRSTLAK